MHDSSVALDQLRIQLRNAFTAWTGDVATAEDLTQETFLAAWSSPNRPEGEADLTRWLYGVARNIHARHRKALAIHGYRLVSLPDDAAVFDIAADPADLDDTLHYAEVADLLDTALGHVPVESRQALLLRYVEALPQREIAAHLGMGEKALEARLHRGKRALQRFLVTDGLDHARALGLVSASHEWQVTNLWCNVCGRQRLVGRWAEDGGVRLDCPACDLLDGARSCHTSDVRNLTCGMRSFGAANNRISDAVYAWSRERIDPIWRCPYCVHPVRVWRTETSLVGVPEFWLDCPTCPGRFYSNPLGIAGSRPEFRQWERRERRIWFDPRSGTIEHDGVPTLHLIWRSHTSASTWEALYQRDTMTLFGIAIDGIVNPRKAT